MTTTLKQNQACQQAIAPYQKPSLLRSYWQIVNSFFAYILMLILMYFSLDYSYWYTLGLAVIATGLYLRTFIIVHDCGHQSFFQTEFANRLWGGICGFFTFTPFLYWRFDHNMHHATSGDLDRRGWGDIWTMTTDEYAAAGRGEKFCYRLYRNPFFFLLFGPLYLLFFRFRIPNMRLQKREVISIIRTDLLLIGFIILMHYTIGIGNYLLIQAPIALLGTIVGEWLFYVQHQFEGTYWNKHEKWDYFTACFKGSSFYDLPKVLHWYTGNIGYHHVHHYNAKIPNYYLPACHKKISEFFKVKPVKFWKSFGALKLRLWDPKAEKLITFRQYRRAHATR